MNAQQTQNIINNVEAILNNKKTSKVLKAKIETLQEKAFSIYSNEWDDAKIALFNNDIRYYAKHALSALINDKKADVSHFENAIKSIETSLNEYIILKSDVEEFEQLSAKNSAKLLNNTTFHLSAITNEVLLDSAIRALEIDDTHNMTIADIVEKRSQSVEDELESKMILTSDSKAESLMKNHKARLRTCETFKKASDKALDLIIANSDTQTLEYLMNYKNYKTAERILDAARMLTESGKYSSILDYTKQAIKRSTYEKTSVDGLCNISGQCYSRISNAIKALFFFDLIEVSNATLSDNNRLIAAMSKETMIKSKASK